LEIGRAIKRIHPDFSLPCFKKGLEREILPLELKQRMHLIADRIEAGLPEHPPELFSILIASLNRKKPGLKGFLIWPLTEVVSRRGISHFSEAMEALSEMTKRFSCGEVIFRNFLKSHIPHSLILKNCLVMGAITSASQSRTTSTISAKNIQIS
jgi:hypothetical protein